jgi:hypothetical protein
VRIPITAECVAKGGFVVLQKPVQTPRVLPVVLTKDTKLFEKGPIIIGAHYPLTVIHEDDGYGYVEDQPICKGPLRIIFQFFDRGETAVNTSCEKCGLNIPHSEIIYQMRGEWLNAMCRWLIGKVESQHEKNVTCDRASLCINRTLQPASPLLYHPPIALGLVAPYTEDYGRVYEHACKAYSFMLRWTLESTQKASEEIRRQRGYK